MATIADIRQKFPQYDDMSDSELAAAVHRKFYSDMSVEEFNQKVGIKAEAEAKEPDDHGLARRQAMSPAERLVSPVTEYPRNYADMNREAREQFSHGVSQFSNAVSTAKPLYEEGGPQSLWEGIKGAGNVAMGALGYVASPISAAYRSQFGNPVEDATGIPREYTEFATQLLTPGIGITRVPKAPGAPVNPAEIVPPRPAAAELPQAGPSGADAAFAMERLREQGIAVDVPRAITTDSTSLQRTGQGLSHTPIVGDPIAKAVHDTLPGQIEQARDVLATQRGGATEANAASRAGTLVSEAAAAETKAAAEAARVSDDAVMAAHQRAVDEANARIAAQETQSLERARTSVGDMSPQDMGETLITRLRQGEQEAQQVKNRLYREAGESDATIDANAVRNVRNHVNQVVSRDDVIVDPGVNGASQTPAARSMLNALDRYAELRAPENMVAPAAAPVGAGETVERVALSVQGIDQMRKHLGNLARTAENPTDRRAASSIMRAFENWETNAFDNMLFSGSREGLETIRRARGANRDLMQRFGYNADPGQAGAADRLLNRIATGEVTPQEVANWLVGSSQVGAKGESTRLLHRITEATRGDPEALQAIRSGVWNRLSQAAEGTTAKTPERIASDINQFLNGTGRALARDLYTPEQMEVMRGYADTLRQAQTARELTAEAARNTRPGAMTVEKGPMQQLSDRVIGGKLGKDEALWKTIEGYAKEGGDVKALARLMRELPPDMKGDIAGAIVRGLGDSNRTGKFSLDAFATDWGKITPQAKAILFGNAGAHVKALDDLATIAQRLKDVKGKYGNPSGTGQTTAFHKLAAIMTGIIGGQFAPSTAMTAVGGAVAGNIGARILATPASASSIAKYAKALEKAEQSPSPASQAVVTMAERNLLNTIKTLGAVRGAPQSPRMLQGTMPAGANNEQR